MEWKKIQSIEKGTDSQYEFFLLFLLNSHYFIMFTSSEIIPHYNQNRQYYLLFTNKTVKKIMFRVFLFLLRLWNMLCDISKQRLGVTKI